MANEGGDGDANKTGESNNEEKPWHERSLAGSVQWILDNIKTGIGILVAALGLVGLAQLPWIVAANSGPDSVSTGSPSISTSVPPMSAGCLAYQGADDLRWQETYDDGDFALVECSRSHQFEIVERDDETTCRDAGIAVIDRGQMFFSTRELIRELGPSGCAIGRFLNAMVETDNFRITKSKSPVATFGNCLEPADAEAYIKDRTIGARVPCSRGKALTRGILITDEDPEAVCTEWAARFHSTKHFYAGVTMDEGDRGVVCALILKYAD